MLTITSHPKHGELISVQDLAEGFGLTHPQKLNLYRCPKRVRVKGLSYVRLSDVIDAVRYDHFSGGGTWPTKAFQAFIRSFREAPKSSVWQIAEDDSWVLGGLDCSVTIKPLPPNHTEGNYRMDIDVLGDSDWYVEWLMDEVRCWPRYYFGLEAAKSEAEAWLKRRNQFVK